MLGVVPSLLALAPQSPREHVAAAWPLLRWLTSLAAGRMSGNVDPSHLPWARAVLWCYCCVAITCTLPLPHHRPHWLLATRRAVSTPAVFRGSGRCCGGAAARLPRARYGLGRGRGQADAATVAVWPSWRSSPRSIHLPTEPLPTSVVMFH